MFDCLFDSWIFFDKQEERKFQIINSFCQSEEIYVNQLEFVEIHYEIPLFNNLSEFLLLGDKKLILNEAKLKQLFFSFSEIRKLSKSFLKNLQHQIKSYPSLFMIGDLFKSNVC